MKRTITLALWVAVALTACSREQPAQEDAAQPEHAQQESAEAALQQSWPEYVAATIREYYRRNPEQAVYAGLHEYDGKASDLSMQAFADEMAWLDDVIAATTAYKNLEGVEAFERNYLVQALRSDLFTLRDSGFITNNPLLYARSLGFGVYVDREYAPIEQRIQAYTRYIANVPRMLEQMQENLQPPLPAPYINTAYSIFSGLAGYLDNTVPGLFAAVEDEVLQREFTAANSAAQDAVRLSAEWLESLKETATDNFALGEQKFLKMLRDNEGVDISLAELKAAGQADLDRNLATLRKACAEFAPELSIKDCVLKVQADKPPEGAVAGARRQLPMLKKFVEDHNIVSIPGTEDALVAEAPPHRRSNAAYIEIPGPFEKGLPSVYYIAPPDPTWSKEDQLAYIPGEADLLAISVHEVWPGHFLQFLHANRTDNNVGRHFSTYTFTEGWGHYTEQMMLDAGLGNGDPEVEIGQLLNALLRNVRYMSALGLHTGGMSVEESRKMFEEQAFQDYGNALQQANRGTYDPGYLNYTLGKLMINKLRDDWTAGRGGREAWGRFHDEFLSYGSPPIPLVRRQMLGPDYKGDTTLLPE
ncbi:MAG TPA: DUF885 domain-containing protein [Woeseiaceae bacterium]|nr:DUF885 domain-containing protein [Woeseiaceae bacterium]